MNANAKEELADVVQMDGREYLSYKPFPIHVALARASAAGDDGNISFEHEAANLDARSLALGARTCGGKMIVRFRQRLHRGRRLRRSRCVFPPLGWTPSWSTLIRP